MLRPSTISFTKTVLACALVSRLVIAGTLDSDQLEWYEHYKQQPNAPQPEEMLLNEGAEPPLSEGFKLLFNGKNLSGWTPKGGNCNFKVDKGCIVGTCVPGSPSTYLCTDNADFTNFIFTCEMLWEVDGNTGVMFRAQLRSDEENPETVFGPQAEMEEFQKNRGWSGGVYGQSCGGYFYPLWLKEHQAARAALRNEGWNRLTISAQGNVVKTWVNGVPAAHWIDDGSYPEGFFGLQIHQGSQGTIRFKNIRVKELE